LQWPKRWSRVDSNEFPLDVIAILIVNCV